MSIIIEKIHLDWEEESLHALAFLPDAQSTIQSTFALFTHGFSDHKGSLLNWAVRLSESGVPTLIFDLPGHYLGSFCEVKSFESFKQFAPSLFFKCYLKLKELFCEHFPLNEYQVEDPLHKIVLGGHSLGALLSLMALNLKEFEGKYIQSLCVGLGLPPENEVHLFQTPFFKDTLKVREQLVSPELAPNRVLPWIFEEKKNIALAQKTVHFIAGEDDLVIGKNGAERLAEIIKKQGNQVTVEKVKRLPHHMPELASGIVKKYFRTSGLIVP